MSIIIAVIGLFHVTPSFLKVFIYAVFLCAFSANVIIFSLLINSRVFGFLMTKTLGQSLTKLLIIMMISQFMLLSLGNFQVNSISATHDTAAKIYTPCVKTASMFSVAGKLCKSYSSAFLDMNTYSFPFFIKQKLVFVFVVMFSYLSPIYSIYKPPKN